MRIVIYGALGLIALILQMGLVPHILIEGQGPMLGIVPVVVVGLLYGPSEGAWAGGVIGALTDLSLGSGWGLATLVYMAAGFLAGRLAFIGRGALMALSLFACALAEVAVRDVATAAQVVAGAHVSVAALVPGIVGIAYTAVLAPPLLALLDGRIGASRRKARAEV